MPNTFSAGTPAKASEVNANFTALANAVNLIDGRPIPFSIYDSNQNWMGYVGIGVFIKRNDRIYSVGMDKNGFISSRVIFNIYYESDDCSGAAYGDTGPTGASDFTIPIDVIIGSMGYVLGNSYETGKNFRSKRTWTGAVYAPCSASFMGVSWYTPLLQVDLSMFVPPFSAH